MRQSAWHHSDLDVLVLILPPLSSLLETPNPAARTKSRSFKPLFLTRILQLAHYLPQPQCKGLRMTVRFPLAFPIPDPPTLIRQGRFLLTF